MNSCQRRSDGRCDGWLCCWRLLFFIQTWRHELPLIVCGVSSDPRPPVSLIQNSAEPAARTWLRVRGQRLEVTVNESLILSSGSNLLSPVLLNKQKKERMKVWFRTKERKQTFYPEWRYELNYSPVCINNYLNTLLWILPQVYVFFSHVFLSLTHTMFSVSSYFTRSCFLHLIELNLFADDIISFLQVKIQSMSVICLFVERLWSFISANYAQINLFKIYFILGSLGFCTEIMILFAPHYHLLCMNEPTFC